MYEDELTADIQHDLAMAMADGGSDDDMIEELRRRGAPLPINCQWVHDPYARFKQRLVYDLP